LFYVAVALTLNNKCIGHYQVAIRQGLGRPRNIRTTWRAKGSKATMAKLRANKNELNVVI